MSPVDKLRKEQNNSSKYFDNEGNFVSTNNIESATNTLDKKAAAAARLHGKPQKEEKEKFSKSHYLTRINAMMERLKKSK